MTETELIYHYTNAQGLKGIVENHVIWATDVWYMNDTREATFAYDVIEEFLESKVGDANPRRKAVARLALDSTRRLHEKTDKLPGSFIACFSKKPDLLSQWRAYCPDGGFSIGFDRNALGQLAANLANTDQHTVRDVIYEPQGQFAALESHFYRETANQSSDIPTAAGLFLVWSQMLAPALKNKAFEEESEVRLHLFWSADTQTSRSLQFRVSAMGLTPYLEIALSVEELPSPIREIIIGPSTYPIHTERAVKQFLAHHGFDNVKLRHSTVPLR